MPRRALTAGAAAVLLGGAVVAGAALLVPADGAPAPRAGAAALRTAPVTSGRVGTETRAVGTLLYPASTPVAAAAAGVVTWLPKEGTVLRPGAVLATIDARPVVLLRGSLPAYRTFEKGMPDGQDVRQLEEGLAALGYFRGDVDERFSEWTVAGIRAWQRALGLRPTGRVAHASVLFTRHDLRVAQRRTRLGAVVAPGADLYATSATRRVVRVDLALKDQRLARAGTRVTVELPTGADARGRVTRVGSPRQRQTETGTSVVVPVTVKLRDPRAAAAFARATVTVRLRSPSRTGVLTVPVEALVALGPERFGVEVPDGDATRRVPVRVGAFVAGRAEIAGRGIAAGTRVVVPSS